MSVVVTLEGFEKLLAVVDPVRFTKEIDKAVDRAAGILRDDVKRMPPVSGPRDGYEAKGIPVGQKHGGTLRQMIQARKLGLMAAEIYGGASYTGYVHDGTSRVMSRPFFKWVLEDFGGLQKVDILLTAALERVASP